MAYYGRGGNAGGSNMNWFNTQKSEFLRERQQSELNTHLKWYAKNEGVTLPGGGADGLGGTGRSMSSTMSSTGGGRPSTAALSSPGSPMSDTGGSLTSRPHMTYMDTIRAQVEPFDHKALQESMAGDWTSSRGAFRDPRQFAQPVVRGNMKMKTERLEYQEDVIKRSAVFGK